MPGDSPAGNRRLSGIKAQSGKIADACAKEKPPPPENERRADSMAWGRNFPGRNRSGMPIHRAHTGAIANRRPRGAGQEFTPA